MRNKSNLPSILDNMLSKSLSDIVGNDFTTSMPSVNIIEEEESFMIEVAAPGLSKGDFNLKIDDDSLIVSAKKETKSESGEKGKFTRREFNYTSFKRSFTLPETVDQEAINAEYNNGVLFITLNKKTEAVKAEPRKIKIT